MSQLRTIENVEVRGKRALVRIDADIDLGPDGNMEPGGDHRLRGCVPTLQLLHEKGARIVLLAHLGRPDGRVVESLRTARIAERLSSLLGLPVRAVANIVGPDVRDAVLAMQDGDIVFLENVRFDPREEENDPSLARELAALGDLYVNEAFAVSHREHASLVAITDVLPSYAGPLLAHEIDTLQRVFAHPEHPVVAVVSGAKLETKIGLLRSLLPRVDHLLTGGGVANMFLRAQGMTVGASLIEPHLDAEVRQLVQTFGAKIVVPVDVRVAQDGDEKRPAILTVDKLGPRDVIFDIGPLTAQKYCEVVGSARTCIWNGPLGKVELAAYQEGTRTFATCVQSPSIYSVVGGGDTVTALMQMGVAERFNHVSSGGGALIAFLEGASLPAVDTLRV